MKPQFALSIFSAFLLFAMSAAKTVAQNADTTNSAPECYALLIGINSYDKANLSGCENDSRAIKKLLVERFSFKSDSEHIKELYSKDATRQAILSAFKNQLIDKAKKLKKEGKEGIFVFQYSGHGSQVPDVSGDEADGRDETICPVDVITNDPKNDILDDEIEQLVKEVTEYTDNLILIMDCCHSGTNTRATDFTARRLERPELFKSEIKTRGELPHDKKTILPQSKRYIAMSGCLADELALETTIDNEEQGLMTNALVDVLSSSSTDMTYQQLLSKVTAKVNRSASSQNPTFEGDLDRVVFKGAGSRGMPSFKVTDTGKDNEVRINAGTASGVEKGGIVAFYKKGILKLSGDEGKITIGDVIDAESFSATVRLAEVPGNDVVMTDAQAVSVTPYFGKKKLAVALQEPSSPRSSIEPRLDAGIIDKLAERLNSNEAFRCTVSKQDPLSASKKDWSLAVLARTRRDFVNAGGKFDNSNGIKYGSQLGYYVATKEGAPLYNLFVPSEAKNADQLLLDALKSRSRQESLKAFSNDRSSLTNEVNVRLQRATSSKPIPGTSKFTYSYEDLPADNRGLPTFKNEERFRFAITNNSKSVLYVSGICAAVNGSIAVAFPPHTTGDRLEKGQTFFTSGLHVHGHSGIETLLLCFTTSPVDYSPLSQEAPALAALSSVRGDENTSGGVKNMLLQALYKPGDATRDLTVDAPPALDDWCTKRIDYRVSQ